MRKTSANHTCKIMIVMDIADTQMCVTAQSFHFAWLLNNVWSIVNTSCRTYTPICDNEPYNCNTFTEWFAFMMTGISGRLAGKQIDYDYWGSHSQQFATYKVRSISLETN